MANTYLGDHLYTPSDELVASPASPVMSVLMSSGTYGREMGTIGSVDTDTVAIMVDRQYLLYIARTFENQRLLQAFSLHQQSDGAGNMALVCQPRNLYNTMTLEAACASIGQIYTGGSWPATDWSGSGGSAYVQALNAGPLKEFKIQIHRV